MDQVLGESFSVWGAGHDTTTYTCNFFNFCF